MYSPIPLDAVSVVPWWPGRDDEAHLVVVPDRLQGQADAGGDIADLHHARLSLLISSTLP
jgi:hypothetical protein